LQGIVNIVKSNPQRPVYVVLGATGAIGSELSRRLALSGANIVLGGRNRETLEDLAHEFDCPSHTIEAHESASIQQCIQSAAETYGRIDGIVNCIGSVLLKAAHMTSEDEWNDTIVVNLTSAFWVVRAAGKLMHRTGGSVVLISSAAARIGLANHEAIAAAKAGIIGLTQSAESTSIAMHALGRLGEPADIASAIEWLLQPANNWITGQVIGIDGGLATLAPRNKTTK
jgi:3-oxoacyl-[acyl-carrier protein] reductase